MLVGVNNAVKVAKQTLGAKGRYTVIEHAGNAPSVTKDGVNSLSSLNPKDPVERAGTAFVQVASLKTVGKVGDGTTQTAVLTGAIINEGYKMIVAKANPVLLKQGIELAVKDVVETIEGLAVKVEDDSKEVANIAKVSANNDAYLGGLVSDALAAVTRHGLTRVEQSQDENSTLTLVKGYEMLSGFEDPSFINSGSDCVLENPFILLTEDEVHSFAPINEVYALIQDTGRPLVVISGGLKGEGMAAAMNNSRSDASPFFALPIKAFGFGSDKADRLLDMAAYTGATVMSQSLGNDISDITIEDLGQVDSVKSSKDRTILLKDSSMSKAVKNRIDVLMDRASGTSNEANKNTLTQRAGMLKGIIAVISIGATTEPELKEKFDRLEDAMYAVQTAVKGGVVAGGGVSLLLSKGTRTEFSHKDIKAGYDIVNEALEAPVRAMLSNAGISPDVIVRDLQKARKGYGYNLITDKIENMFKAGILDPALVPITALESASSAAVMMLTTGSLIIEDVPETPPIIIQNSQPNY